MRRVARCSPALLGLTIGLGALAFEVEAPDSKVNPVTGQIEIADPFWTSNGQDIRYVINTGITTEPVIATVSDDALDDRRPRIAISSSGDAWVTWWRDDTEDKVLVRKHTQDGDTWSSVRQVSSSGESSRNPVVAHDGSGAWVAYEFDDQGDVTIAVGSIIDEPDPIGARVVVATTDYTGSIDTRIHAESGKLWVTWIDSSTEVGWSEYDAQSESWSDPAYESYASDTVPAARERIRDDVLGG